MSERPLAEAERSGPDATATQRARRSKWVPAVILFAVAGLVGASLGQTPHIDLDPSWSVGISWAHSSGLGFGSEVTLTYGPLGFSGAPILVSTPLTLISMLVNVMLVFVALTAVYAASILRYRSTRLAVLFAGGFVVFICFVSPWHWSMVASLLVLVLASMPGLTLRHAEWLLGLGASLAAVALLVKFSAGWLIPVIGLVAALQGAPGRRLRRLVVSAACFLGTLAFLWVALRQPVGGLWPYLTTSMDLTTGYVDMSFEELSRTGEYRLLIISAGFAVYLSARVARAAPAWGLSMLIITWWAARLGFVRHDAHSLNYFMWLLPIAMLAGLLDIGARPERKSVALAASIALTFLALIGSYGVFLFDLPRNLAYRGQGVEEWIFSPGYRAAIHDAAQRQIRDQAALPDDVANQLGSGKWHAEPIDVSLLWAYGAEWSPLPVFQSYSAYTRDLDALNAEALARESPRILERIGFAIDGRRPLWESPQVRLAMACGYEATHGDEHWQVLERSGTVCGEPVAVGEPTRVVPGGLVPVPALPAGEHLLLMSVRVEDSLPSRIIRSLWKDYYPVFVSVDSTPYRVPRGHLGADLILCANPGQGFPRPVPEVCPSHVSVGRTGVVEFSTVTRTSR